MTDEPRSLGCQDWRSTRRGLLAPATRSIRIPGEVFASEHAVSRRDFLAGVGLATLAGSLAACGVGGPGVERAIEAGAAANDPNAPILVSLYLEGGNDGLNTLVPLREKRYHALRSRLALDLDSVIGLGDSDEFGWNPALTRIAKLYEQGKVAVLPSVDYAKPDLSHFNSAEYWRTGIVGHTAVSTGWLGRTLDLIGTPENPLQGLSVQDRLDPVLLSANVPVATVISPGDYSFWLEQMEGDDRMAELFADLARGQARYDALAEARSAFANVVRIRERLRPVAAEEQRQKDAETGDYPDTTLGRSLSSLGRMLSAGLGTRVAAVIDDGGYDTHEDQPEHHAKLLSDLDAAVGAWQADLERRELSHRVLTLIWSEFGRRPQDNDSNGTDHGSGGLALLVGDRANGGVRSEFPGLAKLDEEDNLIVSTEFRAVYATLLEDWMGVDAAQVLPGALPARLPLVAAA